MNDIKNISGEVRFEVYYLFKTASGISQKLTGTMTNTGDFNLAVAVDSFFSGDSLLDRHMREAVEAQLFPHALGRGKLNLGVFNHAQFPQEVEVEFHGVKKRYQITTEQNGKKAWFMLLLDDHKIKRPSLLGIKIKNEVKVSFKLQWST